MFDTLAQVGFAIALLLPGFLVVQLSERRRPSRPAGGDLELILRGLAYALIIQAAAAGVGWLPHLIRAVSGRHHQPTDHLGALAVYGLVVCVVLPTAFGLLLGTWLSRAEGRGSLRWWHYAFGGRDARRGWDYMFSRPGGQWLRVVLRDPTADGPAVIVGQYGQRSWASQSPADPDLYLQAAWHADATGLLDEEDFERGSVGSVWLSADQIARIEVMPDQRGDRETTGARSRLVAWLTREVFARVAISRPKILRNVLRTQRSSRSSSSNQLRTSRARTSTTTTARSSTD